MKNRILFIGLMVAILVAGSATDLRAQDRDGTAGAQYLLVPLTARTTSLATGITSGAPTVNGLEGLYSNPALLSENPGTNALFSHMAYVADIGVNYFGVAQNFGANNIALSVSAWNSGDIPFQTEDNPEIGQVTWDASFITVGGAYARRFTDRISAGINLKYVTERIDDMSASNVVADAGMSYVVPESGLRFGVSLKNFGFATAYAGEGLNREVQLPDQDPGARPSSTQLEGAEFEMPSLLNFGASYTRSLGASADVTVLGNFRSNSFSQNEYSGALEVGVMDVVYLRGGYQYHPNDDASAWESWSIGGGINLDVAGSNLFVDYAYRPMSRLGDAQFVTASVVL